MSMKVRSNRRLWLLACVATAAGLGAATLGGCGGDDVPSDGVATVGDTVIERADFDRWVKVNAQSQARGSEAAVPDPPEFTRCVAAKRRQAQPEGMGKPSADLLKRQCKQEYDRLKPMVMEFLITAAWLQQEAEAQQVKVSESEVKRSLDAQKEQAFPDAGAYKAFLRTSGMTEGDLLYRRKVESLEQKLNEKVRSAAPIEEPSEAEVRRYYNENKESFAQPELRHLNVVVTETRDESERAKAALAAGESFSRVAERFSIDEASKRQGGRLLVGEGRQSKALDRAVFKAAKGELEGPVKTPFGYYVFEVTKVVPPSRPSFEQAKPIVRSQLRSRSQQQAVTAFEKRLRAKYRAKTICADGFRVHQCTNGPKEATRPDIGGSEGQAGGAPPRPAPPAPPRTERRRPSNS